MLIRTISSENALHAGYIIGEAMRWRSWLKPRFLVDPRLLAATGLPSSWRLLGRALSDRSVGRRLHPPGTDQQPDAPHQGRDNADECRQRIGCRKAFGTYHPALRQVAQARKAHQDADRPRGSCGPNDHNCEQQECAAEHEALIASDAPPQPTDRFSPCKRTDFSTSGALAQ